MKVIGRFVVVLSLFLAGCAHVMSDESLKLVDRRITFEDLRREPDSYIGKYVLLGGTIAGVKNAKDGGEMEVLQAPLDYSGLPEETHYSGGRFIVVTTKFLDPLVYKSGRKVTVVGEVKGTKTRMIDEVSYTYPVVAEVEIRLMEKYESDRYYYYPPYYPYYYDPYWGGAWWPYRRPFYPYYYGW